MSLSANPWKLGLFVLAGSAAFFGGIAWLAIARLQTSNHVAHAYFDEALTGLEEGSPVRFRGVLIGTVASITVAPDKRHLRVTAALHDKAMIHLGLDPTRLDTKDPFPPGLRARVESSAITSSSFLQVDYFPDEEVKDPKTLPFPVEPNTIATVPSTLKTLAEGLTILARKLPPVLDETKALMADVRGELSKLKLEELATRVRSTLETIERQVNTLGDLPAMRSVGGAADDVRALVQSWQQPDGPVQSLVADLRALSKQVEGNMARLNDTLDANLRQADLGATSSSLRGAADEAAGLARDARADLDQLRRSLASIERVMNQLERDANSFLFGRTPGSSPLRKN